MANNFFGIACTQRPPTRGHRPAVWECTLGTVYALNEAGECRFFDYDHQAALAFAGVVPGADNRLHPITKLLNFNYVKTGPAGSNPNLGQTVMWVPRTVQR